MEPGKPVPAPEAESCGQSIPLGLDQTTRLGGIETDNCLIKKLTATTEYIPKR